MSILVGPDTRLVVQGITGREGAFHATRNKAYGTNVVAGVTPGKGGQDVEGIPVFDTVADAVEARHYPLLPPATPVPFLDALRDTVNFLGVLIAANLLAIILYILVTPAAPFIFWGLNGFLLGREYFTLAAIRRVGRARAKEMRRENGATIWAAGALMAIPLSVPLVNLVIPILGAATFTHIFHRVNRT